MRTLAHRLVLLVAAALLVGGSSPGGCKKSKSESAAPPPAPPGWELGSGDHTPSSVTWTVLGASASGFATPRDLAFNPRVSGQLWVVNANASVVIVTNAPSPSRTFQTRTDLHAPHFMPYPSALAFGADWTSFGTPGTFATAAESNNGGNNFMGPSLWSSDLSIFAIADPYGLGSHIDMLHCSPYAMGIAWERDNVYWVFGGGMSDIVRYDFQVDHNVGQDDHSDGTKHHYVGGQVLRYANVPSHLSFDPATKLLYIADTGNGRVAKLNTLAGTVGSNHAGPESVVADKYMTGVTLTNLVPPGGGLTRPSGLEFHNGLIYVSDYATGLIKAYDPTGALINWIDTGLGANALMGLAFGPEGKLYFVDAKNHRVLRIDP